MLKYDILFSPSRIKCKFSHLEYSNHDYDGDDEFFLNAHVRIRRVPAPAACTVLIELLTNILFVINKVLSSFIFSSVLKNFLI